MPFGVTLKTAFQIWARLDCPTSLRLKLHAEAGEWAEVLAVKVEPENFLNPFDYAKANAAVCLLKKCPDVPGASEDERRAKALASWKSGEALCYQTNQRLSEFEVSPNSGGLPAQFLRGVSGHVLNWLGRVPDDDELKQRARHGPGTTFSSTVANPTAADKYCDLMSITSDAVIHLLNLAGTKWMDLTINRPGITSESAFDVVRGNRHAFAPKTALTHRNIAIEPSVNMYFQLAVGSAMRARMRKRMGWDLDNAAGIHRKMAKRGSVDGSLATIDLTNASDSLSKTLVKVLLGSSPWFWLLDDLRSKRTRIDGKWHLLEKFSSMGNGYTFELESCVFAAIAAECLIIKGIKPVFGENFGIFGDDIVVPTECREFVVAALRWCGFEINASKSFHTGPFRESCGGDYFDGYPVRGFYLKAALSKASHQRTFTLYNGVRELFSRCRVPFYDGMSDEILELLPKHLRAIGGSSRLGDSVLHGRQAKYSWSRGIRWVKAVRWSKPILIRWAHFSEEARLACRLTGYGHTFGIDSRGVRSCSELIWVTDS